jgi:hypothetical protein
MADFESAAARPTLFESLFLPNTQMRFLKSFQCPTTQTIAEFCRKQSEKATLKNFIHTV